MDRLRCIEDRLTPEARVLEFGPLDRPLVTADRARVDYADHADRTALLAKYANSPEVNPDRIPEIAHVLPDNDLDRIASTGARYDLIVAAHVFEHIPNPLAWLASLGELLTPIGAVFLVVPDARYTFDIARPRSDISDWVEAWAERRDRPAARHIFEHFSAARAVDTGAIWAGTAPEDWERLANHSAFFGLEKAKVSAWREAYIDTHCSVFSPADLVRLAREAARLGLFPFRFGGFWPTEPEDMEFAFLLSPLPPREAAEPPLDTQAACAARAGLADAAADAGLAARIAEREAADHRFKTRYRAALARTLWERDADGFEARHGFPVLADETP